jgi:hypothetical protein
MSDEGKALAGCLIGDLYTIGCMIAAVVSYDLHHSVFWTTLHIPLSWGYVFYALCG